MATARGEFAARLKAIERAIGQDWLQNRALTEEEHNETARLVRNGLLVVGVAAMEDLIKARVKELLLHLPTGGISFDDLPEEMRQAATWGVMKSASGNLTRIWKAIGEDLVQCIQETARDISSTQNDVYTLSEYTFGYERSNLTAESISGIAKAFGLKDVWRQISAVATRVGLSSPSHEEAFKQLLRGRHQAAHQAAAETEVTDLQAFVTHARGIGLGFDAVLSRATRLISESDSEILGARIEVEQDIVIRFVDQGTDGYWREHGEGRGTYRRLLDRESLTREALPRARTRHALLVVRNTSGTPFEWSSTDVE